MKSISMKKAQATSMGNPNHQIKHIMKPNITFENKHNQTRNSNSTISTSLTPSDTCDYNN